MKTKLISISLIALLLTFCKKKEDPKTDPPVPVSDTTPPVITLNGKTNDTTYLQASYSDPGASVIDDTDGNITSSLIIKGSVNNTLTGVYFLNYNAKDAAGNQAAAITRTVHVQNTALFLDGNYNVTCTCTAEISNANPTVTTSNYTANCITSNSMNNNFSLSALKTGPENVAPIAFLNGNSISIYYNSALYPIGTKSGTLSANKSSFTINTLAYDQMYPSRTYSCVNIFTKQ